MVTHDQSLAPRFSRTLRIVDGELENLPTADNQKLTSNPPDLPNVQPADQRSGRRK
jgi:hypothetical protein